MYWTWISGSPSSVPGNYGGLRQSTLSNVIGSRNGAIHWQDKFTDTVWIFGGYGYDGSTFGKSDTSLTNNI